MEHDDQNHFNDELEIFNRVIPRNTELLDSQDVNAKIGMQPNMSSDVIGIHGLYNGNTKGKDLLFILKSIKFRVLLTYFKMGSRPRLPLVLHAISFE